MWVVCPPADHLGLLSRPRLAVNPSLQVFILQRCEGWQRERGGMPPEGAAPTALRPHTRSQSGVCRPGPVAILFWPFVRAGWGFQHNIKKSYHPTWTRWAQEPSRVEAANGSHTPRGGRDQGAPSGAPPHRDRPGGHKVGALRVSVGSASRPGQSQDGARHPLDADRRGAATGAREHVATAGRVRARRWQKARSGFTDLLAIEAGVDPSRRPRAAPPAIAVVKRRVRATAATAVEGQRPRGPPVDRGRGRCPFALDQLVRGVFA